jgi:SAM-dependent methyltransferase
MSHFQTRRNCPSCSSPRYKTIYSRGFLESPIKEFLESFYTPQGKIDFEYVRGEAFVLDECLQCRTVYQRHIPDEAFAEKLYTEWIDADTVYDCDVKNANLDYYAGLAQEIMMVIAYFTVSPGKLKFFDYGMGWGQWAAMARAFGCEVYGFELSQKKCAGAQLQGIRMLSPADCGAHQFDLINANEVFEHIAEPRQALQVLAKSIKPQGLIKISVPDGGDIARRLKAGRWQAPKCSPWSLNAVSPLEHINCFTRHSLVRMADTAGLEPVTMPLSVQYRAATNWRLFKPSLKNLLKPLHQNFVKRGTYLFFRKVSTTQSM